MAKGVMTENARRVFDFLKEHNGADMTAQEVAAELNVSLSTVTGTVNGLKKKGFADRREVVTKGADGKDVTTKYVALTEAGMAYDPDAAVAE